MRTTMSKREICAGVIFLGLLIAADEGMAATPVVVADEACIRHAVDIASFATCHDGRVAQPVDDMPPSVRVVSDEACARYAIDIASFATCVDGRVARVDEAVPGADSHLPRR